MDHGDQIGHCQWGKQAKILCICVMGVKEEERDREIGGEREG